MKPARWRVGRKVGRTIYLQRGLEPSDNDILIGVMDTPDYAEHVVNAHNASVATPSTHILCRFGCRRFEEDR